MKNLTKYIIVLSLVFTCSTASATDIKASDAALSLIDNGLSETNSAKQNNNAKDFLQDALENPETLNAVVKSYLIKDSGWQFLKDVDFKFKIFEPTGNENKSSLGFSYAYEKTITSISLGPKCGDACVRGLNANFSASGNVAFEENINPENFLTTKLNFAMFQSDGGAKKFTTEQQKSYNAKVLELATIEDQATYDKAVVDLLKMTRTALTNQIYGELSADLSLESNQDFSKKQFVYAAKAGLDYKGWEKSDATQWSDTSTLSRLNLLDYPFAMIRMLTGYSSSFVPRGLSLPTVIVAIGLVNPIDGDPRKAVGDDSNFPRFNAEASFKTPIAKFNESPVSFSVNYKIFQEIGASAAVKDSKLDQNSYLTSTIGCSTGPFISYTNGKLPFELKSKEVYSLGFQAHF